MIKPKKSPIGEDRVAKLALSANMLPLQSQNQESPTDRRLAGGVLGHLIDNYAFFVPINLQSGYISIFIMANWSFRFNLIDMRKTQHTFKIL